MGSVVTGRIPNGAIREVGLSGETVLICETARWDVEVEILGHPALVIGEFCHPVEFAIAGVGEAVGLTDGGGVTDFCGHVLHVGDLGKIGGIGRVRHYGDSDSASIGAGRHGVVDLGAEGEGVGVVGRSLGGLLGLGLIEWNGLISGRSIGSTGAEVVAPSVTGEVVGIGSSRLAKGGNGSAGIGIEAL